MLHLALILPGLGNYNNSVNYYNHINTRKKLSFASTQVKHSLMKLNSIEIG